VRRSPTQAKIGLEWATVLFLKIDVRRWPTQRYVRCLGTEILQRIISDAGWLIQARFWLEWGSSTLGQSFPAARSRRRAVHSDSISTRPSAPVA
jgi:hypothetical protein